MVNDIFCGFVTNLVDFRRPVDGFVVDVDVDAGNDERGHLGAVESVQTTGVDLDSPVAAHQLVSGQEKNDVSLTNQATEYHQIKEVKQSFKLHAAVPLTEFTSERIQHLLKFLCFATKYIMARL